MTGEPTFETAIYRAAVTGIAVFTAAAAVSFCYFTWRLRHVRR